jgi:hypothetical protein
MPIYRHATYAGETITLQNPYLRFDFHKRVTGWGWGEIFTPAGRCMAVLDHLGELMLRDQEIPMRLEAPEVKQEIGDFSDIPGRGGQRLTLAVKSLIIKEKLRGTSFEPWLNYPLDLHCMEGEVTITLPANRPILYLSYRLVSKANQYARYVRGPWLKVGEETFGAVKTDAILPGVEWLVGDEWSSGTEWFKDPWAMRWGPHPNKVAAPVMAVSHEGTGIGLAWAPNRWTTGWFNYRRHRPQPVFASPNFMDRRNNHLLGLMAPDVEIEALENQVYMEPPLELHLEQRVQFDAEVFLVDGDSLDVIVDWVHRHGLPEPPTPRWPLPEALDRIAAAYNAPLWHEGHGFGTEQSPRHIRPVPPAFADRYIAANPASQLARELKAKVDWCRQQPGCPTEPSREELLRHGQELMGWQQVDGSFPFDPHGRHYRKDDFVVATTYLEPMGLAGDTALDITVLPALELLQLADQPGEAAFREAARKALDYCLPMQRPEGGDFWETPLHAPNLLAAGHAAVAYYLGYRAFSDERYRRKAIHWIRSLLPFTHLWEPAHVKMLYNTKPCLCSSDWYFANWVRDHVQWEVLETFALSLRLGIDWAAIDPAIDWNRYHLGITVAALRWMLDHRDGTWLPHNLPWTLTLYEQGRLDMCFADTHNSVTGNYGGMGIPPDVIAVNVLGLLERAGR